MMRCKMRLGPMFVLACAIAAASCAGGGSPSSPSALSATPGVASDGGARLRTLDDPPAPGPAVPAVPDPAVPTSVTVNIVGSSGTLSYNPNPVTAAVGDMLVWSNNDALKHRIILDDPTDDGIDDSVDLGDLMPGASSLPVPLKSAAVQFHCSFHPSMKGGINKAPPPDVPDMSMPPSGPDPYMPPGNYDGYRQRSSAR